MNKTITASEWLNLKPDKRPTVELFGEVVRSIEPTSSPEILKVRLHSVSIDVTCTFHLNIIGGDRE